MNWDKDVLWKGKGVEWDGVFDEETGEWTSNEKVVEEADVGEGGSRGAVPTWARRATERPKPATREPKRTLRKKGKKGSVLSSYVYIHVC